MAGEGDYKPPKGHDRHLNDSERAHSGAAGAKVRHGADALGKLKRQQRVLDAEDRLNAVRGTGTKAELDAEDDLGWERGR